MQAQTAPQNQTAAAPEGAILDTLIIGGGFAGLTAAIYAARAGLSALVLEPQIPGGAITASELVENWPTQAAIGGLQLGQLLQKQAEQCGARIDYGLVNKIRKLENVFTAELDGGRIVRGRTVIYAAGASPRQIGAAGEQEFRGRGVSYCATCDGAFYRKKNVAVIGGGSTAVQEALYLSSLAKSVTIVHRRAVFRAEKILLDRVRAKTNIVLRTPYTAAEIVGEGGTLTGVRLRHALSGELEILLCNGVFIYAGVRPNTAPLQGLAQLTEDGYLASGEDTKTSAAGLFAAGDVRKKDLRQLVTAAADGAVAATMAERYLQELTV